MLVVGSSSKGKSLYGLVMIFIAGLFYSASSSAAIAPTTAYVLGIFPYLPPREIEKIYAPIAEDFSKILGKPVRLETRRTYRDFTDAMAANQFDIVFTQPFDFAWAADNHGFNALATRQSMLTAIMVTLPESPVQKIEDLKGKKVASTDKQAAVSFLMRDKLSQLGLIAGKDLEIEYHRSHFSCMQQVLIKRAEACITAHPALRFFEHKMSRKLKIVGHTQEIPHSLFAADQDVSPHEQDLLRERILSWSQTESGKALLANGRMKAFRAVNNSDYDSVRTIAERYRQQ